MELESFINRDEVHEAVVRGLVTSLKNKISAEVENEAKKIIVDSISQQVSEIVAEIIANPFQPTNTYGEPKGAEVTLKEAIIVETQEFLTKKRYSKDQYDKKFKKTTYEATHTGLEAMVFPMVQAEIEKEIKSHLGQMVADVKRQAADAAWKVFVKEFEVTK